MGIQSNFMAKKPEVNMNFKLFQITHKNDTLTDITSIVIKLEKH